MHHADYVIPARNRLGNQPRFNGGHRRRLATNVKQIGRHTLNRFPTLDTLNSMNYLLKKSLGLLLVAAAAGISPALAQTLADTPKDELLARIPATFAFATNQYQVLLDGCQGQSNLPRTIASGKLKLVGPRDWTSGFVPGSHWYLFEYTGDARWKTLAQDSTARLESIKDYRGTHDLGFMLYCSYGNGYRLTRDPHYREVLIEGARSLATRFKPEVGLIRSWDNPTWKYPVIIDNMMNLELLSWAAGAAPDPALKQIALQHADKTLVNHYRPDGSTWHVVEYDPANGQVMKKQTHQGAADDSAWARGQAWGLYGYTMMYRETGQSNYLAQAGKVARFLMNHPRLPVDKIPYWDFDAPGIPNEPRDASSAAIMASALIELSQYVEPAFGRQCLEFARQQLLSLSAPPYLAKLGENGGFLLQHSTGSKPMNSEVDVPLNYADYYFLEGLTRYHNLKEHGKVFVAPAAK